eukprot:356401-Amphidinium_carterae.1
MLVLWTICDVEVVVVVVEKGLIGVTAQDVEIIGPVLGMWLLVRPALVALSLEMEVAYCSGVMGSHSSRT